MKDQTRESQLLAALCWIYDRITVDDGMTPKEQRETIRQIKNVIVGNPSPASKYVPNEWDASKSVLEAALTAGVPPAEPLDESATWFRNLNVGIRQLVFEQASRSSRPHLLAAIDAAIDRLRGVPPEPSQKQCGDVGHPLTCNCYPSRPSQTPEAQK